jgi:nicotinate-nucleotide adenylyltransferase
MKIGLYFGSFNPIHTGHLIIASHVLNGADLQKVWFIVSPQNPFKKSKGLLDSQKRFELVKKSLAGDKRLSASDVEFFLSRPSFTSNTLHYLKEKFPQHNFSIIMGSDSFIHLNEWKNYREIIANYRIFVYPRPGIKIKNKLRARITILDAPQIEISSSRIRELIKDGKSIRYLVPDAARKEIEKQGYYKK